ncbi:MAG: hypothetical protein QRY74_03345 [Chlamydia sp.]
MTHFKRHFYLFFIGTRLLLFLYLVFASVGLLPDEAQYWTWSRSLQYGYYSKPPGIAWQIALSSFLFAKAGFDVAPRVISFCIWPFIAALFLKKSLFLLLKDCSFSYLVATLYLFSPLGLFGSIFATTDGAVIALSFATLYSLLSISHKDPHQVNRYAILGACCIGIGSFWKWTILLFLPILLYEYCRQNKASIGVFLGIAFIALLGLLPPLLWNVQHNWITFRHIGSSFAAPQRAYGFRSGIEFFFSSTSLISFGYWLMGGFGLKISLFSSISFLRKEGYEGIRLIALFTFFIWGGLFLLSFFQKIQGNWALISTPPFFLFLGIGLYSLSERAQKKALLWMLSLSVATQLIVFSLHLSTIPRLVLASPIKQGIGLQKIGEVLERAGYSMPDGYFLLSDRYQNIAQIEAYAPNRPRTVYFMNLWNIRMNEYALRSFERDVWLKKDGFFLAIIPEREMNMLEMRIEKYFLALGPYFDTIIYLGNSPLSTPNQIDARQLLLFHCQSYNGKQLPNMEFESY